MFLIRLATALKELSVRYALVGGYAVSLHGAVRGTIDVDIIISLTEKDYINAERALGSIGLQPRLPVTAIEVFKFRQEYIKNRNLVAWSFVNSNNPIEVVDIIITHDLNEIKTVDMAVGSEKIRVIALPELIKMKASSNRPQDIEDIKALRKLK